MCDGSPIKHICFGQGKMEAPSPLWAMARRNSSTPHSSLKLFQTTQKTAAICYSFNQALPKVGLFQKYQHFGSFSWGSSLCVVPEFSRASPQVLKPRLRNLFQNDLTSHSLDFPICKLVILCQNPVAMVKTDSVESDRCVYTILKCASFP